MCEDKEEIEERRKTIGIPNIRVLTDREFRIRERFLNDVLTKTCSEAPSREDTEYNRLAPWEIAPEYMAWLETEGFDKALTDICPGIVEQPETPPVSLRYSEKEGVIGFFVDVWGQHNLNPAFFYITMKDYAELLHSTYIEEREHLITLKPSPVPKQSGTGEPVFVDIKESILFDLLCQMEPSSVPPPQKKGGTPHTLCLTDFLHELFVNKAVHHVLPAVMLNQDHPDKPPLKMGFYSSEKEIPLDLKGDEDPSVKWTQLSPAGIELFWGKAPSSLRERLGRKNERG
jgi:hypothetical protein